jgi:hypothetical protein
LFQCANADDHSAPIGYSHWVSLDLAGSSDAQTERFDDITIGFILLGKICFRLVAPKEDDSRTSVLHAFLQFGFFDGDLECVGEFLPDRCRSSGRYENSVESADRQVDATILERGKVSIDRRRRIGSHR